ncbi:uncharacterized protein LOC126373840 [Pectinophora gossypiella]|uniref:uncharacterized protein LOC126373840 n=1 Tax=Pectinophora gossypiella TaxID=13191 RepID=UPI00214ED96E|nr:uncharacterized protein LOC126373840 [Pectinophora gossypiella]
MKYKNANTMHQFILLLFSTLNLCCANYLADVDDGFIEDLTTSFRINEGSRTTFHIPDEKWVSAALKDIAYYLRNYKYNEWDRRYHKDKPENIGYFDVFPVPPLKSLHWQVYENCADNFYKCIVYLHSIITSAPFTRSADTVMALDFSMSPDENFESVKFLEEDICKKGLLSSEKSGLPFENVLERFEWRTTASYYMCWYTMLGIPDLSMIGESCDNFANCIQPVSYHNHDIRADDRQSFACAMHSFCPDPCCPIKYLKNKAQCYAAKVNPCYLENADDPSERQCTLHRGENLNLKDIVLNRWNITCHCKEPGFKWSSRHGMCVDVNECSTGEHNCDLMWHDCLNLPGSYQCVCKFGLQYDKKNKKKCVISELTLEPESYVFYNENKSGWFERFISYILNLLK